MREALALAIASLLLLPGDAVPRRPQPAAQTAPAPVAAEEFVGPFPSWTNVRTAFGAVGDGAADDTAALQRGLDQLSAGGPPVLYIPSGTYRITRTLNISFTIQVSIVGEDPDTTRLVWDGEAGGTMLAVNGVAYSRFNRFTLDGQRRASILVDQSWDNSRAHFDTGNEYADIRFLDAAYGIRGGFKDHGFAETSVVRSHFVRNTEAGISLGNFNALDLWIWDSRFEDCGVGVTNGAGAGNFHVYSSVFRRSRSADLAMGNTGGFSARGNYSAGSRAFFMSTALKAYPATIHLQGNVILDPTAAIPIDLMNQGPGLLTDNVIRQRPDQGPAVRWTAFYGADVTSIGNSFTVKPPIRNSGRLTSVADRIVAPGEIAAAEPALPGTPPNLRRPVFELAAGASAASVQDAIDRAALQRGSRPIVHFAHGTYAIDRTLSVPPGDVQLVGDGGGTRLQWAGEGRGPVVRITGPTQTTLRELSIDAAGRADGVVVDGIDQPGARIFMEQAQLRSGRDTDLFVNGLDHATVELRDFGHAYSPTASSVKILGGPLLSAGKPAAAQTNVWSGASSGNAVSYEVTAGGRLLVRDLWYESGAGPGFARIRGAAVVTVDGSRISSPPNQTPPAFAIEDLSGHVAIVATHIDDRIAVSGDGRASKVLGLAVYDQQPQPRYFANETSPAAQVSLVNSRHGMAGSRSVASPPVGLGEPRFIEELLAQTRGAMPGPLGPLPAGVTDLRLFRVWVTRGLNNITLTR